MWRQGSKEETEPGSMTLDVAFGAVGHSLGHLIELVDRISTCDEKGSSRSRKGGTGSVGEEASMQVRRYEGNERGALWVTQSVRQSVSQSVSRSVSQSGRQAVGTVVVRL